MIGPSELSSDKREKMPPCPWYLLLTSSSIESTTAPRPLLSIIDAFAAEEVSHVLQHGIFNVRKKHIKTIF
ncbi:hypothetical protein M1146_03745 [Patescibacteria group bacterium]|nr:hypothetical protein [Patescibacteria group bacterium]